MNYAQQQADPRRHVIGITIVVLFHVLIIYVLVTGLAKKVIDVVRAPIETKVIEEIKKPPPPPEVVLPPPPKLEAPPPPFIPPPEIQIATPPPAPTITATTSTPPPAPVTIAPAPPVVAAPPAPAAPVRIGAICPTQVQPTIPRKALQEGINGFVKAKLTIHGGKVTAVEILESRPHGLYDSAVRFAVSQYSCARSDQDVVAEQEFNFKIQE